MLMEATKNEILYQKNLRKNWNLSRLFYLLKQINKNYILFSNELE